MSFYDWYCDLPPSSPQTWGEQTDVPESADWYNSGFIMMWGSNVPQTRTPDAHFMTEARYKGTQVVTITPDYSEASKFGDIWLNPRQGTDAALGMAMGHVILREFISTIRQNILTIIAAPIPICRFWLNLKNVAAAMCQDAWCAPPIFKGKPQ
jgi:nitrate reductase alpha subunit